MKKKTTIILAVVVCLMLVMFLLPQTRNVAIIIFIFPIMSATIGPLMGIFYPFTLLFKVQYISGLFVSGALFVTGILKRKKWWSKILIMLGVLLWILLGFIGLGTGV